jgi:hypothetical protein
MDEKDLPLPMFVLQLKKTLSPGGTTRDSGTFVKKIPKISQYFWLLPLLVINRYRYAPSP